MKACMDGVRWSGTLIKNQAHCKAEGKLFFSSRHFRQSLPIIHSFITFIYICKRIPFTLSPINPLSFTKSEHSSTHIHTHCSLIFSVSHASKLIIIIVFAVAASIWNVMVHNRMKNFVYAEKMAYFTR